jgi:Tol biopolymer transport system component
MSWHPSGTRLVFSKSGAIDRIFLLPVGGTPALLNTGFVDRPENWPAYSPDGQWIYFASGTGDPYGTTELWKVRETGTERTRLGPATPAGYADVHPWPSPDGTRLVFATTRNSGYGNTPEIAVVTLADTSVAYLGVYGLTPRWAPDGSLIAYVRDDSLWVVEPDGLAPRTIGALDIPVSPGLAWSPDSGWLVVQAGAHLVVVERATGWTIPIPRSEGLGLPAWMP